MTTLLLGPRYSEDSQAIWRAALSSSQVLPVLRRACQQASDLLSEGEPWILHRDPSLVQEFSA